jgi:hypothetical protein
MSTCAACGRDNPEHAAFCASCGGRLPALEPAAPKSGEGRRGAPKAPPRPAAERRPSRLALRLVGLVGFLALAAATGYKAASKPGRHVPAADPKLRALPAPGPDDEEPPPASAPSTAATTEEPAEPSEEPKPVAEPKPAAKTKPVTKTAAKTKPGAEPLAAKPKPKPKPKPALGGPPDQSEIEACINTRKAKLRACADEAAQQGEFVRRGSATATLSPNGKLSNIAVPGGSGVFSDCVTRVISSLRCRQFRGSPVEVSYRLR